MSGGENLLYFVDRSDPGLGGLCGNISLGERDYDGEAENNNNQGIRHSQEVKRIKVQTWKIESNGSCNLS